MCIIVKNLLHFHSFLETAQKKKRNRAKGGNLEITEWEQHTGRQEVASYRCVFAIGQIYAGRCFFFALCGRGTTTTTATSSPFILRLNFSTFLLRRLFAIYANSSRLRFLSRIHELFFQLRSVCNCASAAQSHY